MTLVHATCVALDGTGILIRGPSGSGKSDLGLRLIDMGAKLVADDYCELTANGSVLTVRAPAAIAGRMEVRGYGLVKLPSLSSVVVSLVVDLKDTAAIPRFPDVVSCTIEGITMTWIAVDPTEPSAPAKVRLAARGTEREPPQ